MQAVAPTPRPADRSRILRAAGGGCADATVIHACADLSQGGGTNAVVLLHDGDHGAPLIDALARFGDGLPANVLPVQVNEVTQVGPEVIAALFAYGAAGAALLTRAKPRRSSRLPAGGRSVGNHRRRARLGDELVRIIETDDPDELLAMLNAVPAGVATRKPATFVPRGAKRGLLETAFAGTAPGCASARRCRGACALAVGGCC